MQKSDRGEIEILSEREYSIGEIAKILKRSKSGIWYEMNKKHKKGKYEAKFADHVTCIRMRRNRAVGRKIATDKELKTKEKSLKDQVKSTKDGVWATWREISSFPEEAAKEWFLV